jgi:hypothetical protein
MRHFFAVFLIIFCVAGISQGQEPGIQPSSFWPPLTTSINITQSLDFCGEPVDLGSREVRERFEKGS